uniref:non-reducing end alpha-L-arabinofuranosidase n=1 Tax=Wollemia nobilis TaxID=56998 RepID=A0A0C9QPK7_9CONI
MEESCGILKFLLSFVVLLCGGALVCAEMQNQTVYLDVDAGKPVRQIPSTLFGIFFEEINHAGAGGLWAELVNNRGFEAGGPNTPSNIDPWSNIGDTGSVLLVTDLSSCFERNKVALRMEVLCDSEGPNLCPAGGVGVYNPGYWGMNIVEGESYRVALWIRSTGSVNLSVAFTSKDGMQILAASTIIASSSEVQNWTKKEFILKAAATDHYARLSLTSSQKGIIWLDQVSAMPMNTFKGHGFRKELAEMLVNIKPRFIRFPGGCFVEGQYLRNAFRWRQSIGPWEERPGHFGDVWNYWTDDGLGYYEFLQLAEDLNALPIWVFNNGISHTDEVSTSTIEAFIQDILNGLEFARGPSNSTWGSVRATMGHPDPFNLKYVAIGNEDCGKQYYRGNYLKFYDAIKLFYPDIKIISNCDGSSQPLDHPADMYDYHIYTSANNIFSMTNKFDSTSRTGPKAFVSEYAVTGKDAGTGSLLAALGEAVFLIGLEQNSDVVEMASYAPLFVNTNDRRWNPDAIVFDSWQQYGTPSYWVQHLFKESSGATLLPITIQNAISGFVISAIKWSDSANGDKFIRVKAVNFGSSMLTLEISVTGLPGGVSLSGSKLRILTSKNVTDENSFDHPEKIVPKEVAIKNVGCDTSILVPLHSVIVLDMPVDPVLHSAI